MQQKKIKRVRINSYHFLVLVSSTPSQQAPPCVQVEHASKVSHGFHPHYYERSMTTYTDMEEELIHICAKIDFTNILDLASPSKEEDEEK